MSQGACVRCLPAAYLEVLGGLGKGETMEAESAPAGRSLREATQRRLQRFSELRGTKGGTLAPPLQWIEGVLYVLGYLLECHFLLLITCGPRTLAQAELMFLFFILLSLCFLYVVLVTFLL